RIWYRYYEEFKITHISGNTKFELYQVQNGTIIEDTLVAL
ncbi:uncharacterized protein METZ01_LOCUS446260, partial [marine metagenome]